jgi:FMN-dependent NADH-azoreductase
MSTLLLLKTSLFAEDGASSRLANEYVKVWRAAHIHGVVVERNLAAQPAPHLTAERFLAFTSKPGERTAEQQAALDYSDALIDELKRADEIVLTAPMYNFGVPSGLKAYFDHVARAGVTFRYTANGPIGLLTNKRVTVIATRGGVYAGTVKDTASAYLRDFLAFLGLTDVEFVYAEGLALGAEHKQRALGDAQSSLLALALGESLTRAA